MNTERPKIIKMCLLHFVYSVWHVQTGISMGKDCQIRYNLEDEFEA